MISGIVYKDRAAASKAAENNSEREPGTPWGVYPCETTAGWTVERAADYHHRRAQFMVKDSGERQQFDSGMVRDVTTDKIFWHLVFDGPMLKRYAEHLTKGAEKYGPANWMKAEGEPEMERFRNSAARHFAQWMAGDTDEDHAAAVMFNLNGFEYVKGKQL